MIIKEVLTQLENSAIPVVRVLKTYTAGKTLALGFKKGMVLTEHKTAIPAKLVVVEGTVIYKQEGKSIELDKFSDLDIPVGVPHAVEAQEDSVCLLILGN
ncbi:MAG: hypothetical protein ACTHJ8_20370 [Mucilaginibacter sp.]|jgi:quercetin dioxygenase-like cupin family protein